MIKGEQMTTQPKSNQTKRLGRPKKSELDKVQYQRIAVYYSDYDRFKDKLDQNSEALTDAFSKMVDYYCSLD